MEPACQLAALTTAAIAGAGEAVVDRRTPKEYSAFSGWKESFKEQELKNAWPAGVGIPREFAPVVGHT
jgi:hypothetical protein